MFSNNQKKIIRINDSYVNKIIESQVNDWIAKNKDKYIKLVFVRKNIISISMEFDNYKHIIEISCPNNYPMNKKGFSCREIRTSNVVPLNFIPLVNKRFENKKLSIEKVLTYLADIFNKYKMIKSSKITSNSNLGNNNNTNVVFNTNTSIEPNDWNVINTSESEKITSKTEPHQKTSHQEEENILVPQILSILQEDDSLTKDKSDHCNNSNSTNIIDENEKKDNSKTLSNNNSMDKTLLEGANISKDREYFEGSTSKGNNRTNVENLFENNFTSIVKTVIEEIIENGTKSLNSETRIEINENKSSATKIVPVISDRSSTVDTKLEEKPKEIKEDVSNCIKYISKQVMDDEYYNMDDHISYGDVDDPIGLYLDLGKYVRDDNFPFDENKLIANAIRLQDKTNFDNVFHIIKTFSPIGAVNVILNEFKKLYYSGLKNNYSVYPINENLYHLKLVFAKEFFDIGSKIYKDIGQYGKSVEIEIKINGKVYPFYPPRVRIVTPGLVKRIYGRVATMECLLLSKWNPHFTIESIIGHFKKLMDQYGEFDTTATEVDAELEDELIELSLLSEVPARSNLLLTLEELKNIGKSTFIIGSMKKNHGDNGTGYGHSGLKEWDFKTTFKIKEERHSKMMRCIRNIIVRLTKLILNNTNIDIVGIIKDSCFIPYLKSVFCGNNILELLKNPSFFETLLNSMRIMDKRFVPLFMIKDNENEKSLYEILGEINQECQLYLNNLNSNNPSKSKTDTGNEEINLVSNFISFYRRLEEQVGILRTETLNKGCTENKTFREIYRDALCEEICRPYENMNLQAFSVLLSETRENINSKFNSDNTTKQIIKEILSHHKSLPMEPSSSIFYRYNPNNLKFHEFVIVGPEGTPYDAGCFHFRMYCTSDYPNKSPRVRFYTTGNGNVKFNPNLYEDGRICLSILGTWHAQAGESWIPGVSTMLQIMVSIQSLVMNSEPYYNEPGNETLKGTNSGEINSRSYNYIVRLETMRWAMIDMIKNPPKGFENAILTHFRLRASYIRDVCKLWTKEAPSKMSNEYNIVYSLLCEELDKLVNK